MRLQSDFEGKIDLYLGAELDYIPTSEVQEFQQRHVFESDIQYFVGSVHFLGDGDTPASFDGTEVEFQRILRDSYKGDIHLMVGDYYKRLANVPTMPGVIIVGHLDVIKRWNRGNAYFRSDEQWYRDHVDDALVSIAKSDTAVELNTAGWRKGLGEPYPSSDILRRCGDLNIPITISSDAHDPRQLHWGFAQAAALLDSLDIVPVNPADLLGSK